MNRPVPDTAWTLSAAARWAALVGGASILLALVPHLHNKLPPDTVLTVAETRFTVSSLPTVPGEDETNWSYQALPDDWYINHPKASHGWYRTTLELEAVPNRPWAIYLPTVNMNAAVYVNGRLIGDGGHFGNPVARNWNRPLLFTLPDSLLFSGKNVLAIRIKADPLGSGFLGKIYLGPEASLNPVYEQRLLLKVSVVWAITIGLGFLALFIGSLWLLRRNESIYGLFGLVALSWAAHNLNILVVNIPVSTWFWDWTTRYGMLQLFAISSVVFVNRYIEDPQPVPEKALYLVGAAVALAAPALDSQSFYLLARKIWAPVMLSAGLYVIYRLWQAYRKKPKAELIGLLISALFVAVFGLRDALIMHQLWDREHGFYIQYSAPIVLVVFAWILLKHFVNALTTAETLNVELEQRVEEKRLELERNYLQLQTLERERILAEERERFMRDMHDGVGGQLVSTLALIDCGRADLTEVSAALRAALDDLRLMIDSLDATASDLTTLLGMLRGRMQNRLKANGIQVRWQITQLPPIPGFGSQKALQVMRIVQEAVTNVFKHAQAQILILRTDVEKTAAGRGSVIIEIVDDGIGINGALSQGRGLRNMRHRAGAVGADLSIQSGACGTCIRIAFPLY